MSKKHYFLILSFLLLLSSTVFGNGKNNKKKFRKEQQWAQSASNYLLETKVDSTYPILLPRVELDTLYKKRGININFTEEFAYHALRKEDIKLVSKDLRHYLKLHRWKRLHVNIDGLPLEQYVPVYFSEKKDKERMDKPYKGNVNVRCISQPFQTKQGLNGRHIALWNSHGLYYKRELDIWKWQRAPLFTTVEDLFTSAYVLPFLLPMLENAAANVYLPRERDVQTNEIIVDNEDKNYFHSGDAVVKYGQGFKNHMALDSSTVNPFKTGNYVILGEDGVATWNIKVSISGNYAVYISYVTLDKSSDEAEYIVHHSGEETHFMVNQQMGDGTWIYLDNFFFNKDSVAKIILKGSPKGVVTADAVRLGGGMGSIPRGGKVSGAPRWEEAARYYLQYAGALDSITFNRHGDTIDYNDDFRCRARWVNYLKGGNNIEPWICNNAKIEGLHIPIDLSLGLHSDAGHFPSMDTTVGTLAIYRTYDVARNRDFYINGKSRLSNRDLADLVQTQLVNDIRTLYDKRWTRREIWDKMYSEATFAQSPSMLLEIHSHANAQDMRYGLNPQFRFDTSRAIYKAILRFLATYYKQEYVVQPLPVSNVAIKRQNKKLTLSWEATNDQLEPTAAPDAYVVYTRIDGEDWDNGTLTENTSYEINVTDSVLRSYKVTAVNDGGESFPSTILSACLSDADAPTVLVVDGFTRVSAPFFMENGDSVGVAPWLDEGVPWGIDLATIGWQYNYNQNDQWINDDIPGHGGSYNNLSGTIFAGNRFDNSYSHVKAIANVGYNAISTSIGAVEKGFIDLSQYDVIDLVYGEQRSTELPSGEVKYAIYTQEIMQAIKAYLQNDNARLIISGAHIAGDAETDTTTQLTTERKRFINNVLGFTYGGQIKENYNAIFLSGDTLKYNYNTDYCLPQYRVENADILSPQNGATKAYSYLNDEGAVLFYAPSYKVIASGVPYEAIKGEKKRTILMKKWLEYLMEQQKTNNK